MIVFEKTYDGESIVDLSRDINECLDEEFNLTISVIPQDEYGIHQGKFTVTVKWTPEE